MIMTGPSLVRAAASAKVNSRVDIRKTRCLYLGSSGSVVVQRINELRDVRLAYACALEKACSAPPLLTIFGDSAERIGFQ